VKSTARGLVVAALREWRRGDKFADSILAARWNASELSAPDRAFATELFYGVLRYLTLLDFWIDALRSGRLDPETRDLLRLGLYQLLLLQVPEHAAVFETVALAGSRNRAIVNAVLRNALRRRSRLLASAKEAPLAIRQSHPQFLIDRWKKNFGEEATEALCEWNNQPAPLYARVNQLKVSVADFYSEVGSARCADRTPQRGVPANFICVADVPRTALAAGHCYIQDPSTAVACLLLEPRPGDRALDACAAPGGKTGYLAELMSNNGSILACDRDATRVKTLRENLERLGVGIAQCRQHDWASGKTLEESEASFDRILVDAPCSNTGVMRRRVDVRWRLVPEDFSRMPAQQIRIMGAVVSLLKPGGVLVYSTCSLEPEENEEVVAAIVREFPFLKLIEQRAVLPFRDGFDGAFAAKLVRL
jgi:16S rRNA (cytosine967-C5)-methyltransferase